MVTWVPNRGSYRARKLVFIPMSYVEIGPGVANVVCLWSIRRTGVQIPVWTDFVFPWCKNQILNIIGTGDVPRGSDSMQNSRACLSHKLGDMKERLYGEAGIATTCVSLGCFCLGK